MSTHRTPSSTTPLKKAATVKRSATSSSTRKKAVSKTQPQAELLKELRVGVDALYERVERLRHRVA